MNFSEFQELLREKIIQTAIETNPYTATGYNLKFLCFLRGIDTDTINSKPDAEIRKILLNKIYGNIKTDTIDQKNHRVSFLKQELKKRNAKIKRLQYENDKMQGLIDNNVVASNEAIGAGVYVPDKKIRLYFKDSGDIKPCDTFYVRNVYYQKDNCYAELVKLRKAD